MEMVNNRTFKREDLPKVNVIDAMPGAGKTTWGIKKINSSTNPIVYVTPFKSECDRIGNDCNRIVSLGSIEDDTMLEEYGNTAKLSIFKDLISKGQSIAVTHSLFKLFDSECYTLIKQGKYTLFLDEVVNAISPFEMLKKRDLEMLINDGMIKISDDTGNMEVKWIEQDYVGKFNDEKAKINEGECYYSVIGEKTQRPMLFQELSVGKFVYFKEVTILTYLFEKSELSCFFKSCKLPYTLYSLKDNDIVPYSRFTEDRDRIRSLLHIYNGKLNQNFKGELTKTFYDKSKNKPDIDQIRKNINNYFKNICKAPTEDTLWSCYNVHYKKLSGNKNTSKNFLSFNARAVNEKDSVHYLAYPLNVYTDPTIIYYFKAKGIEYNQDLFALSTLLQWTFRSAIRKGESVHLYLPSERMRDLLEKYFNYEL